MARGKEKVIISREDLPAVSKLSNGTYGYVVRYRIISEDQNRFSHWSPIRELAIPSPLQVTGDLAINISNGGGQASLVWGDEESRPSYDIFVSFNGEDYFYHGTSPTHQYGFILESGTTSVQAAVQIESVNKERSSQIQIFESQAISLV